MRSRAVSLMNLREGLFGGEGGLSGNVREDPDARDALTQLGMRGQQRRGRGRVVGSVRIASGICVVAQHQIDAFAIVRRRTSDRCEMKLRAVLRLDDKR